MKKNSHYFLHALMLPGAIPAVLAIVVIVVIALLVSRWGFATVALYAAALILVPLALVRIKKLLVEKVEKKAAETEAKRRSGLGY